MAWIFAQDPIGAEQTMSTQATPTSQGKPAPQGTKVPPATSAPAQPRHLRNQPPDPRPKRPVFCAPPGSWDCHIHLFGPARDFPFDKSSPYVSDDALPEDYLRMQCTLGMQRAVIVSAGGYGRNSCHLESVLRRFPEFFRGIVLPPIDIKAAEIERLHRIGVRGVRMFAGPAGHEWSHLPRIDARIAELAHAQGWHVQYQSLQHGFLIEVADQLLALPTPVVLDHFGAFDAREGVDGPGFRTVLRMLETGKTWLKLSAPMRSTDEEFPYSRMTPFARMLVKHSPERLLWGSDWPHVQLHDRSMPNDGELVDLLAEWIPDTALRQRVFTRNPLALYE